MNPQLEGIDRIEGTYIFDLRTSMKTLRLNRLFSNLRLTDDRDQSHPDEDWRDAQGGAD